MMDREYWAHPTSLISDEAVIGENTKIWQYCTIMSGVCIGQECMIGQNVFIETGVRLGNRVKVKNHISLYTGVECEDDVFLGPACVFTNVMNPRSFIEKKQEFRKTIVKKGATIGANATILCGHIIGEYAMVGAGTVVTKDVEPYALMMGNPAKQMGYVCVCGQTLNAEKRSTYFCPACGETYTFEKNGNSEK